MHSSPNWTKSPGLSWCERAFKVEAIVSGLSERENQEVERIIKRQKKEQEKYKN